MKAKFTVGIFLAGVAATLLSAQQIKIGIESSQRPVIAIPDFRGAGDAQRVMGALNDTLWSEIETSGLFKMAPKSFYPTAIPQQPTDFKPGGAALASWASPPVSSQWLAFGYTAVRDNQLVLFAWLYNVSQPDISRAQVIGKVYFGSLDDNGARKVAREFAADILKQFGGQSLLGSRLFFVSDRTGHKEIWSMDYDGSNQQQLTNYRSISTFPCVSPDGTKVAFTSYAQGMPKIFVHSTDTGRKVPFYNQSASLNAPGDFTPDGKLLLLYSTAGGGYAQIYSANIDGGNLKRITYARTIDVEPKVNPKTGNDIVFVSGRSGLPQIYKMNIDGADIVRLTTGEGEAVNPSWSPDGQRIAFAWTKGFEPGNYNIFLMDVATRNIVQLTHGAGRNENPVWAPDGIHIVFSSKRGHGNQIFTMLADGTQVKQLTTQGNNEKPAWARAIQ